MGPKESWGSRQWESDYTMALFTLYRGLMSLGLPDTLADFLGCSVDFVCSLRIPHNPYTKPHYPPSSAYLRSPKKKRPSTDAARPVHQPSWLKIPGSEAHERQPQHCLRYTGKQLLRTQVALEPKWHDCLL